MCRHLIQWPWDDHYFIGWSTPFYPSLNQMAFDDNLLLWKSFWERIYCRWVHIWGGVRTNSLEREGFFTLDENYGSDKMPSGSSLMKCQFEPCGNFSNWHSSKVTLSQKSTWKRIRRVPQNVRDDHGLLALSSLAHWDNGEMRKLVKQMGWNA